MKKKIVLNNNAKKEDITIPFIKIGDKDWEKNTRSIIRKYAQLWEENAQAHFGKKAGRFNLTWNDGEPLSEEFMQSKEESLGMRLPESLRLFFLHFNMFQVGGMGLYDYREIHCYDDQLKNIKKSEYKTLFSERDMKYIPNMIFFTRAGGGSDFLCFHDTTEEIFYYDHERPDGNHFHKLVDSFDDYLKIELLRMYLYFFDNKEDVCRWLSEINKMLFHEKLGRKDADMYHDLDFYFS